MTKGKAAYLRAVEIAEHLDVHLQTVRRWIAAGTLPSVQIGGVLRVAEADLLRILQQGSRAARGTLTSEELQP